MKRFICFDHKIQIMDKNIFVFKKQSEKVRMCLWS